MKGKTKAKIFSCIKSTLQGLALVILAILLAICLRVFVFASYKIPSPSMEPAILPGEYILVNKLTLGPRIFKNFKFMDGEKIETKRFHGLRKVKRNDVLVFNFPYSDWNVLKMDPNMFYVKRCVAIPGDSFFIENGFYKVKGSTETLGCLKYQKEISLHGKEDFPSSTFNCFPSDEIHHWNMLNFGPLYVPKSNDHLTITEKNIALYKNLIQYETDKIISVKGNTIFLDGKILKSYTFKLNYYFMAGDYVFDSKDSRYWGLLPEDHIVGKASIIWKSRDPITGNYRFKRFFKAVE
ncbi:MAG: signal peptidase I [Bacteroidales bacterium]|nr:signal peptidase I [Bacteroidales bacterium]MDD4712107.1 signal peptidase I [Bacteroidales bacterium]